ncbi:MAG: MarR family transcriptional regulator [Proteobacteria bacterium]|nr:MarR family transcriptional regulator [Pseudomonadota bacterium]
MKNKALIKSDFEALARFRYQLRQYERLSENIAREEGLTVLQYLLLLQVKGYPGRDWVTVSELAERLQAYHHGVVALVSRCEQRRLIYKTSSVCDRRIVEIRLTVGGERCIARLAQKHRDELMMIREQLMSPYLVERNDETT